MTYPNYNERHHNEAHQVIPNWYRRFLSRVVGFNITYTPVLLAPAPASNKSRLDIHN